MTMNEKTLKLMVAGALVTCAIGAFNVGPVWATDPEGLTSTLIVGPVAFDEIDTRSHMPDHRVRIQTRGLSDVYITHLRIVPGGHGGWHSHPGPSIISVRSGTATFYQADDPTTPQVYPAGTGFAEDAGDVHIVRNEGDTDLELVVLQIVPLGAPRRIDEPAP
jgi:quercetin dioxygenase-like cupin family protein